MRFLAILLKLSETLFSIRFENTMVAFRKRLRHFNSRFLGLYAKGMTQITELDVQKPAHLQFRHRFLNSGEILIVRYHARNMERLALKIIRVKRVDG